jgi:hypothetical protein
MIDSDIKHIIEPELKAGEELLWAEKVDPSKRTAWVESKIRSDKTSMVSLGAGLAVCFFLNLFGLNVYLIILSLICFLGFLNNAVAVINRENRKISLLNLRNTFGYSLSTDRFFLIGQDLRPTRTFDASSLKRAKPFKRLIGIKWRTTNLILAPVGDGILKFVELYFLEDFQASEDYINSKIQRTSP